jgi:DNA-binding NarL/FixJ family response regulator
MICGADAPDYPAPLVVYVTSPPLLPMKKAPRPTLIHVSVLESDPMRLVGLQAVFSSEADIEVRAGSVDSVLHSRHEELVLMTTDRGPSFGSIMAALKTMRPGIRILVTGPGKRDEDILRAVMAGAKGYVPQEAPSAILKKAIREVHAGSVWIPRRIVATFIERTTARHIPARTTPKISPREREVLRLIVSGCSNREIAQDLGIIEQTVKAHVAQLLRKIGVPNRTALSVHAITRSVLIAAE